MLTVDEEDRFVALVRDHGATAVPLEDGSTTAWAGMGIREIWYVGREVVGNALLEKGRLRLGPTSGSNAVHIEVVK
jgi:hypothetical protein